MTYPAWTWSPDDTGPTHRIENRDCLAGLRELADGSVDVVVTSPPYNIGTNYGTYRDRHPMLQYLEWCSEWGAELDRVLHPQGSFFLNIGGKPTDPHIPFAVLNVMTGPFHLQNVLHWIKAYSPGPGQPVKGHTKPINSGRYLADNHEYVFHFSKEGKTPLHREAPGVGVPFADKSNLQRGNRGKRGDVRDAGNVWVLPYDTIQRRDRDRPHPASFPRALPERCIRLHGVGENPQDLVVLDPFLGIGTTGEVAARLGCSFIGFELDPQYYAYAVERIQRLGL
jgi:site-specific DNA-methyltransferase (adenine-specific)